MHLCFASVVFKALELSKYTDVEIFNSYKHCLFSLPCIAVLYRVKTSKDPKGGKRIECADLRYQQSLYTYLTIDPLETAIIRIGHDQMCELHGTMEQPAASS